MDNFRRTVIQQIRDEVPVVAATAVATNNPYITADLVHAQQQYNPSNNSEFETMHNVVNGTKTSNKAKKKTKKVKKQKKSNLRNNDINYRRSIWYYSSDDSSYEEVTDNDSDQEADRELLGHADNTEKLVSKYLRDHKQALQVDIPGCINILCFQFCFVATNVVFAEYDNRVRHSVDISQGGKMISMQSRTIFVFSKDGYSSGHHLWHVKCHRVYNCQAVGICEHKNPQYRYGDNIFDVALNEQLGDRYVYAGDNGHSWRGSNELRPYVCCVYDQEEYYHRMTRSKLHDNRWGPGDIISVELNLGSGRKDDTSKRTVCFFKNGKALCEPIEVVKRCAYYPVFQAYQRATFEIIDDISQEPIYQPEEKEDEKKEKKEQEKKKKKKKKKEEAAAEPEFKLSDLPDTLPTVIRHKSLDSDDESDSD
eukprot:CAMPEP_0197020836 /NCGR_PEP_ID=MMETSP1384-20130603/1711_1 /TAXON_ID=29189 /ORGANISM="Ammonia sp." /LENGTH=422 /DNA_ID=CAMNT_0042448539 /DNA_START=19 /DNA_END=1287 /DNA_ORIENTATION=+